MCRFITVGNQWEEAEGVRGAKADSSGRITAPFPIRHGSRRKPTASSGAYSTYLFFIYFFPSFIYNTRACVCVCTRSCV